MRNTKYARIGFSVIVAMSLVWGSGCTASGGTSSEAASWRRIQQSTAAGFVLINYYPKNFEPSRPDTRSGLDVEQRVAMERIYNENTATAVGVIISDTGEVFTTERELQYPQTVAKITITGCDGKILPARADRLLVKAPGRILRITDKMPDAWKALKFDECDPAKLSPDVTLYAASLGSDEQNHVIIRSCDYGVGWNASQSSMILRVPSAEGFAVICNSQGRPIGVSMVREIELGPAGAAWRGRDILADKGISADEQAQLENKFKNDFARDIYEATLTFRPRPTDDGSGRYGGASFLGGGSRESSTQERLVYGLAFAEDKLLMPGVFARTMIEGIDTISVKVDDKSVAAHFGGVLKQYDAMVFVLDEGKLPRRATFAADARLAQIEPFWAINVRELAGMDMSIDCGRWIAKEQGFAEKWYPVADRAIPSGSWLLDRQGRLVGFYGHSRRQLDRLQPYLFSEDSRYASLPASVRRSVGVPSRSSSSSAETLRLVDAADMASLLSDPAANYDTHIRRMDKEEQKRRMWLGVEYTRPTKEMVKQMNLRQETQDGRIGLVVNRIYPGSPAAKLGLTEGDILLKLAVPEAPWPIELISNERATFEMPTYDEEDVPEEFRTLGLQGSRGRPWPSRDNYLTRMLGEIGAGTTVKLTYIHDSKSLEKEFTIEQAPPDMLAATKYKSDKLGLTVKDLTYEVRAALRLTENDAAVVVTEIEPGTAAAMARINQYELVRAVDGQAIDNVKTFEKLVTEAQKADKESVRITLEWMGKTRLADLKFNAKANVPARIRSLMSGTPDGSDQ